MLHPSCRERKFKLLLYCFYGLVLFFSTGFLLLSAYVFHQTYQLEKYGITTSGKIINSYPDNSNDRTATVYQVAFLAHDKRRYVIEKHLGVQKNTYQLGETVSVLYLPADPENGQISSNEGGYVASIILLLVGLFSLIPLIPAYFKFHKPFLLRGEEFLSTLKRL